MGGSTTCLSSLVKGLAGKGYDCRIALYFTDDEIEKSLFPGIKTYHLEKYFAWFIRYYLVDRKSLPKHMQFFKIVLWGAIFLLEALRRIILTYWIIVSNRIDIVHTNNSLGLNLYSIYAAKLANVPCVCHIRGYESIGALNRRCPEFATAIITMSESVKSALAESPEIQKINASGKMLTIYDGLSEDELAYEYSAEAGLRQEYGIPEEKMMVGMVGMLSEWKGFHLFLEAADEILRQRDDMVFFVIGDSITINEIDYKRSLYDQVKKLGIEKQVFFTGLIMDTRRAFGSLDIVVHASIHPEPFGRVVIEAMAASKPVIAANAGGPVEIIRHGETGLLFKSGNSRDLAHHLMLLAGDPAMRDRIGRNGRVHVENSFCMNRTCAEVEQIYNRILLTGHAA